MGETLVKCGGCKPPTPVQVTSLTPSTLDRLFARAGVPCPVTHAGECEDEETRVLGPGGP